MFVVKHHRGLGKFIAGLGTQIEILNVMGKELYIPCILLCALLVGAFNPIDLYLSKNDGKGLWVWYSVQVQWKPCLITALWMIHKEV